jgi:hypothetical protein
MAIPLEYPAWKPTSVETLDFIRVEQTIKWCVAFEVFNIEMSDRLINAAALDPFFQ